ncbi:hypothetical protein [Enterococcus gilvus]|uniref:hypothetical protein n=1 Tax=Enterococcus gilvus TaxID=160453 RepID=UPI00290698C8|nr:hypothetical protein [Enterococcus gilvus]MDU5511936.1 hypothetical protein [Enterococcus gilvus]
MNKKKIVTALSTTILASTLLVAPGVQVFSTAYAAEASENVTTENMQPGTETTSFVSEQEGTLIDSVQKEQESERVNIFNDENGNTVTEILGTGDEILASKIINNETQESETTTNTGSSVIVEKSSLNEDGTFTITKEVYELLPESELAAANDQDQGKRLTPRTYYDKWSYTGVAVSRAAFSTLVDLSVSGIVGKVAAVLRISRGAADYLVGYMGAKWSSSGTVLAKHLDSNGNGYVALYKRGVRNSKNTQIYAYQHRTY